MRWVWAWLGLAFAVFVTAAFLFWKSRIETGDRSGTVARIRIEKERFQKSSPAVLSISLSDLSPDSELIRTDSALPQYHRYPLSDLQRIRSFQQTCRNAPTHVQPALEKMLLWERFLCGELKLPKGFFASGPRMHPSGTSYAQLARNAGLPTDARFFHILELLKLPDEELDAPLKQAKHTLDFQFLENAQAGGIVLGEKTVGLPATESDAPPGLLRLFDRKAWDVSLRKAGLKVVPRNSDTACLWVDGKACWQIHSDVARRENILLTLAFISGFAFLIGALFLLWERRKLSIQTRKDRHFLLETLTHELRTPVATLLLKIEAFRREFDSLSSGAQTHFLQLADEAQRLKRLVHTSVKYLQADAQDLRFDSIEHASINKALHEWLLPYEKEVTVTSLEKDRPFVGDAYWISLCVKNLVENAIRHGKPPVKVSLHDNAGHLQISVTDGGNYSRSLSQKSSGLGLGLSIVKRVMEKMNGSLRLQQSPTCFSLELKNVLHG